jgi:hypothetical protein
MTGYSTALLVAILFTTSGVAGEVPPNLAAHATSANKSLQEEGREELRLACNAAAKAADYEEFAGLIPIHFKNTVGRYKRLWTRYCGDGESTVSIGDLAEELDGLLEEFSAINDDAYSHKLWRTSDSPIRTATDADDARYLRFDEMVCDRFPLFIPAFKCRPAHIGASFFDKPSLHAIGRIALVRGNAVDQRFWFDYITMTGDPYERDMPWEEIWSEMHGSCIRFGDFDWPGAFMTLASMKERVTRPSYRTKIDSIEKRMLFALDGSRSPDPEISAMYGKLICSCGPKEDALATYARLANRLVSVPGYETLARDIESTRRDIESGQLPFINDQEQHCRGG